MWQKAVAGICVMVGAFGFGLSLCQEINSVLLHFKEQRRMLLFIYREISFLHRPMQEIFAAVGERLKEPYPDFLMAVSKSMEQRSGKNLQEIWREEAEQLQKEGACPKEAVKMLLRIGECFGCEEDKMQMESLKLLETELADEIDSRSEEKEEKSRLIRTLSVLAGIFCIIIFI